MITRRLILFLGCTVGIVSDAEAARLTLDDPVASWSRTPTADKVDFAARMGKAFSSLSPQLDRDYFVRCLEETANIGNPRDTKLEQAVKICVSVHQNADE
ncbi:hypothetical protein MKK58_24500 [Methylobacterium sp. J-078]|uniref:hypothetical protein n=1 Tax=Methylobacterium sp. J-078 TaxID=2836657 RepID=UPI001FBA29E0|nr:hypothetical protein [Methylobacterium sp. J-078]MCJ2047676.1 hypothetical protein [Methylobacterium sp. J-078]